MAEYRELQAAIDAIRDMERHDFEEDHFPDAEYAYNDGLIAAMNAVAAVPAADVAEVRHGRWIEWDDGEGDTFECSACGETWTLNAGNPEENNMHYCPNCGAHMDEWSEDDG